VRIWAGWELDYRIAFGVEVNDLPNPPSWKGKFKAQKHAAVVA